MKPFAPRHTYFDGWRIYPIHAFGHHVQGAVVSLCILAFGGSPAWGVQTITLACLYTLGYVAYQGYSQIRKGDSAGLDVMDYMVGIAIGTWSFLIWHNFP